MHLLKSYLKNIILRSIFRLKSSVFEINTHIHTLTLKKVITSANVHLFKHSNLFVSIYQVIFIAFYWQKSCCIHSNIVSLFTFDLFSPWFNSSKHIKLLTCKLSSSSFNSFQALLVLSFVFCFFWENNLFKQITHRLYLQKASKDCWTSSHYIFSPKK